MGQENEVQDQGGGMGAREILTWGKGVEEGAESGRDL